jgi:hypothetical protein
LFFKRGECLIHFGGFVTTCSIHSIANVFPFLSFIAWNINNATTSWERNEFGGNPIHEFCIVRKYTRLLSIENSFSRSGLNFFDVYDDFYYRNHPKVQYKRYSELSDGNQIEYIRTKNIHDIKKIYYLPFFLHIQLRYHYSDIADFYDVDHVDATKKNKFMFHLAHRLRLLHRSKKYVFDYNLNNMIFDENFGQANNMNRFIHFSERISLANGTLITSKIWDGVFGDPIAHIEDDFALKNSVDDDVLASLDLVAFVYFLVGIYQNKNENDPANLFPVFADDAGLYKPVHFSIEPVFAQYFRK